MSLLGFTGETVFLKSPQAALPQCGCRGAVKAQAAQFVLRRSCPL